MKSGLLNEKLEMVKDDVIAWRRYLHQYPELSFQEEKTSQFVYETLQSFGNLELSRPTRTSVVARLLGREPGKVLAMRADMDALPIQEENEFPFASQNPGIMHACGHDGHTAMLLGAAKILSHWKDQIKGEIRFIFQHAEELPPGGAQEMVKEGVMEGVDRVFGIHLMSTVPFGKIGIGYGTMTSANDTFSIRIQGKGGHSSMPNDTIDPIAIGAQVVSNLQHIASRNCDPMEKFVLSVTSFHGGDALNVIPDTVTLGGSVRSFNPKLRDHVPELMEKIIKGITEAHGASYQFDYQRGYSPVINDDKVTNLIEETILDVWGEDTLLKIPPMMGSEDFSAFANEVPGCFIFVGAGNREKGIIYPHHHPKFTVDEDSLEIGVKLFVNSAFKLLDAQ
ncbi:M20 family metallopeptidase [Ammoniphilus sp. 3BR4]|uniref:M20 family metallopeptidase n=1 Tax=Ammoniphilus sp. 3BR4 TaxID=3158265 RepID=UPI0034658054